MTDGPYGETHELFNGFWILEVSSKEEAVEWASRCPLGPGSKLEVRRVTEPSDFPQDNEFAGWSRGRAGRMTATFDAPTDTPPTGALPEKHRSGGCRRGRRLSMRTRRPPCRTIDAVWRIECARIVATLTA